MSVSAPRIEADSDQYGFAYGSRAGQRSGRRRSRAQRVHAWTLAGWGGLAGVGLIVIWAVYMLATDVFAKL